MHNLSGNTPANCFLGTDREVLRQKLVHLKDRVEPERRAGVVYKIPCRSCTKVYIDQTGRTLEHRLKEHRRALVSRDVSLSVVAQHVVDEGHDIDWSSATVIDGHPKFPPKVCTGSMAHQIPRQPNE